VYKIRTYAVIGLACMMALLHLGGCNEDGSVFVKPKVLLPKVALVGIKFQYREAPDAFGKPLSKAANVMFDRLTDQLILALEKNSEKIILVDIGDIHILPFYKNLGEGLNSNVEYVPSPYKFIDFRKIPQTGKKLCDETGLDVVFTVHVTMESTASNDDDPEQQADYQFFAKITAVDSNGKIIIREDVPINLKLSDFDQRREFRGFEKKSDKDEFTAQVVEKEGFNSQTNRVLYQEQVQVFFSKFIVRLAHTPLPTGNK
jgi:hypothetical protein